MNAGGWSVGWGCPEDVDAVLALERGIAEAPHWPRGAYLAATIPEGGTVRRCLAVAQGELGVIGFAVGAVVLAGGDEVMAELESVAVAAEARGSGIGQALCEAVAGWARGVGAATLELEVRASSHGAIRLYERLGFRVVGRRGRYYEGPADDALQMRMRLTETGSGLETKAL